MMEQEIRFKVYTFWDRDQNPEVKKFKVAKNEITSFSCFRSKLEDVFSDLKYKKYTITWKDYEGDDITISSDSDIQTAIEEYSLPVFKLYVYCQGNDKKKQKSEIFGAPSTSGNTAGNASQAYIICTTCKSPIIGFRYKCISCDDIDLCSKCELMKVHPDHCMIRVPETDFIRNDIKNAIKRSRAFLKTVSTGAQNQPDKKTRRDRSSEKKHRGDTDDRRHGSEHKHGHRSGKACYCRPKKSWLDTFNNYINEFANLAGDIDVNGNEKKPQSHIEDENLDTHDENLREVNVIDSEALKKVITNSCDMLNKVTTEFFKAQASSNCDEVINVDAENKDSENVAVNAKPSTSGKRDFSPDQVGDWTMINKDKDLMDEGEQKAAEADTTTPIGFNLPEEFRACVNLGVENMYPPLNMPTAVMNPQDGLKPQSSSEPKANKSYADKKEMGTNTQEQENKAQETPQPIDPRFQNVIQSLLSMGFMGAQQLADIVEAHNGDITAIIDHLTSHQ